MTRMDKEEMMRRLTETVSHPEFDKFVQEIERQPKDERLKWTKAHATVDEMKRRGIPLEEGFRISVRTFEDPDSPKPEFDIIGTPSDEPAGTWTVCVSLGYVICATVGHTQDEHEEESSEEN